MRCSKCGEYIAPDENFCGMCGESVPPKTKARKNKCIKKMMAIAGVVAVVAATACVLVAIFCKDDSECCVKNLLCGHCKK